MTPDFELEQLIKVWPDLSEERRSCILDIASPSDARMDDATRMEAKFPQNAKILGLPTFCAVTSKTAAQNPWRPWRFRNQPIDCPAGAPLSD
jgi:hypothetical protein